MAEYIKKETVVDIFNAKADMALGTPKEVFHAAVKMVELLPAADVVEVVHARWIAPLFGHFDTPVTCSQCNTLHRIPTCFCSACGAKMDGEGREQ